MAGMVGVAIAAREPEIKGLLSKLADADNQIGMAIDELEKRIGAVLCAPSPSDPSIPTKKETATDLGETLHQHLETMKSRISWLQNIIGRVEL